MTLPSTAVPPVPADPSATAARAETVCVHCGTPFAPAPERPEFCCAGCQYVYGLLHDRGLERYYDLRDGAGMPVGSQVFHSRDLSWLERLQREAEEKGGARLRLGIQGISCVGCVWLLERLYRDLPGARASRVNASAGFIDLEWNAGTCRLADFAEEARRFGYLLGPAGAEPRAGMTVLGKRMGVCGALAMNTMLFTLPRYLGLETGDRLSTLFDAVCAGLATLSMIVGGGYFIGRSWRSLRAGVLHIDLPISLGLVSAFAGSLYAWRLGRSDFAYFDFVSVFAFLMLVGRWLQQRAVESNRNRLLELSVEPAPVRLALPPGAGASPELPVREIRSGMAFEVAPGQAVPVRARLRSPQALLSLGWINGESEARLLQAGDIARSGAINLATTPVEVQAEEAWDDSLLAALLHLEPAREHRNAGLERLIRGYLLVVVLIALLGFAAWRVATGEFFPALTVLIAVLVVSCPCASGTAIPLVEEFVVSRLRRWGVFVRDGSLWPRLASVRNILFDKTGTLTLETLGIEHPEELERLDDGERRALLTLVARSLHPVASCLREQLLARHPDTRILDDVGVREELGSGLEAFVGAVRWRLGRPDWAAPGVDAGPARCLFACGPRVVRAFSFREEIRPDAAAQIRQLQRQGFGVYLLSGDEPARVTAMAEKLGVPADRALGGMSPSDKADWVEHHDAHNALMIGDGANDSLAFDRAWTRGTPAVDRGLLEQKADFYFLGINLTGIGMLFQVARARRRTIRRVFGFAVCYNVVAVGLALGGHMNPLLAAVLMPSSSIVSILIVMHGTRLRALEGSPVRPGE